MKSVPLNAFSRTLARRGGAKALRSKGRIPAVIYGRKTTPQNLEVDARERLPRTEALHQAADFEQRRHARP